MVHHPEVGKLWYVSKGATRPEGVSSDRAGRGGLDSTNRAEWKTLRRKNRVPVTSPKNLTSPEEGQGRKKGERRGGGGWR